MIGFRFTLSISYNRWSFDSIAELVGMLSSFFIAEALNLNPPHRRLHWSYPFCFDRS